MMDAMFRKAVLISILLHLSVISALANAHMPIGVAPAASVISVDYIKESAVEKASSDALEIKAAPKVDMKEHPDPPDEAEPAKAPEDAGDSLAVRQAQVMATSDYINYYQLIREKIRRRLRDGYRSYYAEGEANLVFTLRSDGTLMSSAVDPLTSTYDKALAATALQSLRDAAPFDPFPEALGLPQMSFTVTVSFKKR